MPKNGLLRTQVGAEEIAEVVSRATGIPVSKMMQGERDKLLKMEDRLHQRVVGQDEAAPWWPMPSAVRAPGLSDPNRPERWYSSCSSARPASASTELCKALAGSCSIPPRTPDPHRHERVHGEALGGALIGAPRLRRLRGGGYLTEAVRRKPYA